MKAKTANGGQAAAAREAAPGAQRTAGGFGAKEFIQGLAIGLLLGFLLCLIILR